MRLKENELDLNMTQVVYETSFSNYDTASYKTLQKHLLAWKKKSSLELLNDLKVDGINLLSHGLHTEISEFSVQSVKFKGEDLGSLKLKATVTVHKDPNLAAKMLFLPIFILQNIDFTLYLSISKQLYKVLLHEYPYVEILPPSSKQNQENLLYNISYINGDLMINGMKVF